MLLVTLQGTVRATVLTMSLMKIPVFTTGKTVTTGTSAGCMIERNIATFITVSPRV